jgi:hypothetical protein
VRDDIPPYEQRIERHLQEWQADRRARRRFWIRTVISLWLFALPGFVCGAWAFHVNDPELGGILLQSGQLLVGVAVLGVVYRAILVSRDRGWH